MDIGKLRSGFLDFFAKKDHKLFPSAPLVPADPTMLFNSAGMVPFKDYFLGLRKDVKRAASCQLCMRTTDIDNVGATMRHYTLFEMLGNFSFGDYFKEEVIAWAWEYAADVLGLKKENLWISIYKDDDEAHAIWKKIVPENRIVRLGEEDNFWSMGPTGPCGPCSEIYYDLGSDKSNHNCLPGCDKCERWIEFWNLVFTQFDRQENGKLKTLPRKNIDTGLGFERLVSILENKDPYKTGVFSPIVNALENILKLQYKDTKKPIRIIAEHARSAWMIAACGVVPENVGRGYILRRLIRRGAREARRLKFKEPIISMLGEPVKEIFGDHYREYFENLDSAKKIIEAEEENFAGTLEDGSFMLNEEINRLKCSKKKEFSGSFAFKLYDTYGFPVELIEEALKEEGDFRVNRKEFEKAQEAAREISKKTWKGYEKAGISFDIKAIQAKTQGSTQFIGYESTNSKSKVLCMADDNGKMINEAKAGEAVAVVLDKSPFYPQGGGQAGDKGTLTHKNAGIQISAASSPIPGIIIHEGEVISGKIKEGDEVLATIDAGVRFKTACHHSATHLLHWALRKHFGQNVKQAGSEVNEHKLRLDFTYNKALTQSDITTIEHLINSQILANVARERRTAKIDEAKRMGAMALFGEKYEENVYVVGFGESLEVCGGTHVNTTGEIGAVKIISQSSSSAGVRRIEAVAGVRVKELYDELESRMSEIAKALKVNPNDVLNKAKQITQTADTAKKGKAESPGKTQAKIKESLEGKTPVKKFQYKIQVLEGAQMETLRSLNDQERRSGKGICLQIAQSNDRYLFAVGISKDCHGKLSSAKIAKALTKELGGSAGGRDDFAQGTLTASHKLTPKELGKKLSAIIDEITK
ncbi:alanine--tRNA ligase [Elusimicrobiota bacterium]